MNKPYTVMVIIEAKPNKVDELKQALLKVIKPCRAEPACLEYRLHQDLNNPAQFMLYETWRSQALHQQQFQKPYIIEFINIVGDLLAKPYLAVFAEELLANKT